MTLQQYYDALVAHDWYYHMSDDQGMWQRGKDRGTELKNIGKTSPVFGEMYADVYAHYFSGSAFGTELKPLPKRPEL